MKVSKLIFSFLLLFIITTTTCFADKSKKDADWQYVISRNEISYSVDMNSIKFFNKYMAFWMVTDDKSTNRTGMFYVVVNSSDRTFRFEEAYVYDTTTREQIGYVNEPTQWGKIEKGSVIYSIVTYIFQHHPATKDSMAKG